MIRCGVLGAAVLMALSLPAGSYSVKVGNNTRPATVTADQAVAVNWCATAMRKLAAHCLRESTWLIRMARRSCV